MVGRQEYVNQFFCEVEFCFRDVTGGVDNFHYVGFARAVGSNKNIDPG